MTEPRAGWLRRLFVGAGRTGALFVLALGSGCRSAPVDGLEGELCLCLGSFAALPGEGEFVVGRTTFDGALAAIGSRPDSLEHRAGGERLVCWYGYRLRLSEAGAAPEPILDSYLRLHFDGQGILIASHRLTPGPLPPVDDCTCIWPGVREAFQ